MVTGLGVRLRGPMVRLAGVKVRLRRSLLCFVGVETGLDYASVRFRWSGVWSLARGMWLLELVAGLLWVAAWLMVLMA